MKRPMSSAAGRWPGEHGAGSVLMLSAVMVVMTALLAISVLAAGHTARRQAAAAADLAALAAAERLNSGVADPCATAKQVASSNGARLRECEVDGVEVEVLVHVPAPVPWLPPQNRRARAGPADDP